jgi:hypothetical protein
MTDKTEAQPEALRLAESIDPLTRTQLDNLTLTCAATELRFQHAEIQEVKAQLSEHKAARMAYASEFPPDADGEADVGNVHANIRALKAQLVAQTNRAASAEQQVTALTQRLDMANRLNTDARNQLAQQWKCGNEYLPYHPDASHVDPSYRDGWNDCYRAGAAPAEQSNSVEFGGIKTHPPEQEPLSELQKQALDMYKPPFQFHHGYIFDSAGHMFADEGRPEEAASLIAVRIRGWGRLGKLSNGAEVQDAAGHLVVAALNAFWKQHAIGAKND